MAAVQAAVRSKIRAGHGKYQIRRSSNTAKAKKVMNTELTGRVSYK